MRREGRVREHVAVVEAPQRARVPPSRAIPAEMEERRVERVPAIEPAAVARLLGDAHGDGRDAAKDVAEAAQEARELRTPRAVLVLSKRHQNRQPRGTRSAAVVVVAADDGGTRGAHRRRGGDALEPVVVVVGGGRPVGG